MRWLLRLYEIGKHWWAHVAVALMIGKSTWTFFKCLADGLSVTQALILGLAMFGAVLLAAVGLFYLVDYLAKQLPEWSSRRKAASFFRDMALHGKHPTITLNEAIHYWNGKDPQTPTEWVQADFKLHHLKAAIGQGFLDGIGPGGSVTLATRCRPEDLAAFFGSLRWLRVRDELWKQATYQASQ